MLNLCDEGFKNDPFKELHITALLELLDIPYTGAGPACLAHCFDKSIVSSVAQSLDIPVPLETYFSPDDGMATLPSTFPALLKPNQGDSSLGITRHALVHGPADLLRYCSWIRETLGPRSILAQEFLGGPEYSVGIIGNPGLSYQILPPLVVDYSQLNGDLPPILGYESKWLPESEYWAKIL